jgi:tetratricopeptide (TPR) repeat protein
MNRLRTLVRPPRKRGAVLLLLIGVVAALWLGKIFWMHPSNPQLTTPVVALETLRSTSLYFNGPAFPWLAGNRSDLLIAEDKIPESSRIRRMVQATQNPKLFRQLDREYRFDTLLFIGDPSQSRALLDHLLDTKDFLPVYLDHTSIVFKRDAARSWEPADFAPVRQRFAKPDELAGCLAQAAVKMTALRMFDHAKSALDEAAKLDPQLPDVWSGYANFYLIQGEWKSALENADRALELNKRYLPALGAKSQILYSTKRYTEAWSLSKRIIELAPDEPTLLFYHAKIAHEAQAFDSEVEALQKLISLAEHENRPESTYRIYLAQAYAKQGEAEPALKQLSLALLDRELPEELQKHAEKMQEHIEDQVAKGLGK